MPKPFKTVGLIGRQHQEDLSDTLLALINLLKEKKLNVIVEAETATYLPPDKFQTCSRQELGKCCELIIVVGGDGNILNAARIAVPNQVPVLGINRGRLGFLTDIRPNELQQRVGEVLSGHYFEEKRFLLKATAQYEKEVLLEDIALNDVVLLPSDIPHMIEFAIFIDDQFVTNQRADGLIVATPTGSTAYALSGGGPILHPHLDAMVLVPMSPHTLSARPIVVDGKSVIKLIVAKTNEASPRLSCDGLKRLALRPGSEVKIRKNRQALRLIHPLDYNYFQTLRTKLGWGNGVIDNPCKLHK